MGEMIWDNRFMSRFIPALLAIVPFWIAASVAYSNANSIDKEQTSRIATLEKSVESIIIKQERDAVIIYDIRGELRAINATLGIILKNIDKQTGSEKR